MSFSEDVETLLSVSKTPGRRNISHFEGPGTPQPPRAFSKLHLHMVIGVGQWMLGIFLCAATFILGFPWTVGAPDIPGTQLLAPLSDF